MEKFTPEESKEYRDNLAGKLKEIRTSDPENPEKARTKASGYLEAVKDQTGEYDLARAAHLETVNDLVNTKWQEKARAEERFSDFLVDKQVGTIAGGIKRKEWVELERGLGSISNEAERRVKKRTPIDKWSTYGYSWSPSVIEEEQNEAKKIQDEREQTVESRCKSLIEKIDRKVVAQEVMDGLKAIDESYDNGIVCDDKWMLYRFLVDDKKIDMINYDWEAMGKYIDGLESRIGKIAEAFRYGDYNAKSGEYSGMDKVLECGGDHSAGSRHPTSFECGKSGILQKDLRKERIQKSLTLLEKFKRTPEQIEEEKKKIAEEKKAEKEKKQEEKFDKFDPQI